MNANKPLVECPTHGKQYFEWESRGVQSCYKCGGPCNRYVCPKCDKKTKPGEFALGIAICEKCKNGIKEVLNREKGSERINEELNHLFYRVEEGLFEDKQIIIDFLEEHPNTGAKKLLLAMYDFCEEEERDIKEIKKIMGVETE